MKRVLTVALGATLLCGGAFADEPQGNPLKDDKDQINYSVGYQIGGDFKRQNIDLRSEALIKGIQDAVSGGQPLMSPEDMHTTLVDLKRKIMAEAHQKQHQALAERVDEGRKFLAENAKKEGVVTLPSGLQYKVLKEGAGKQPKASDTVTVNYKGTLVDGTEFDSSYRSGAPVSFQVDGVIPGWTEALQLMKEGGHWQLFIPPKLAYGERGPLADRTLLFDVELISVGKPPANGAAAGDNPAGTTADGDAAQPQKAGATGSAPDAQESTTPAPPEGASAGAGATGTP